LKIAAIYTSTTPELVESVNTELHTRFTGQDIEILSYQNPQILATAREYGHVTPWCAAALVDLYEQARRDGADILFNLCSSVGDVAKLCKPLYEIMGLAFIRVDEAMARDTVHRYERIGIIATLPTTMAPTKRLIEQCALEEGRKITVCEALADGAFGLNQQQFKEKLIETGAGVKDRVQALVFAQGSMAYAKADVSAALNLPVFASVPYGAAAVYEAACAMEGKRNDS